MQVRPLSEIKPVLPFSLIWAAELDFTPKRHSPSHRSFADFHLRQTRGRTIHWEFAPAPKHGKSSRYCGANAKRPTFDFPAARALQTRGDMPMLAPLSTGP